MRLGITSVTTTPRRALGSLSTDAAPDDKVASVPNQLGSSRAGWKTIAQWAATAAGAGAVALAAAIGPAWADPTLDAAVNTTCTYPQVQAAINAESPEVADKFNGSPVAQSWIQKFLDASRSKRQKMIEKAEKRTEATPGSMAVVARILNNCTNY